jgi:hypothetical protein
MGPFDSPDPLSSTMGITAFPARPGDVIALSVEEFLFDLEMTHAPSVESACRAFANDANRALVWLIRWRALNALCARSEVAEWRRTGACTSRDMCEVAAAFDLNDVWEFDHERFCEAVDGLIHRRACRL